MHAPLAHTQQPKFARDGFRRNSGHRTMIAGRLTRPAALPAAASLPAALPPAAMPPATPPPAVFPPAIALPAASPPALLLPACCTVSVTDCLAAYCLAVDSLAASRLAASRWYERFLCGGDRMQRARSSASTHASGSAGIS
eukprot:2219335-Prymnesium_polylepis.1